MKFKIALTLLFSFFAIKGFSQISVGPNHVGRSSNFKNDEFEKFKKTETIFILSNIYDKTEYEQILANSWDVTPYKIVEIQNFKIDDYLSDKYSIAELGGFKKIREMQYGGNSASLYIYIDFKIFDSDKILKKFSKLSAEKKKKKKNSIISDNTLNIAHFYLFPKDDFINTALTKDMDEIVYSLFTEDVFFNYKSGYLKNYFQKINSLIKNEQIYWMYENDYLPELKNLDKNKLYIPSSMSIKYNGLTATDSEEEGENIEELFKNYEYQYEVIKDEALSAKIMNNEEFYYLRYVRTNAERFVQIINSKTGEIIYRDYITGLSYNIKSKNITKLNDKIKKAKKA